MVMLKQLQWLTPKEKLATKAYNRDARLPHLH